MPTSVPTSDEFDALTARVDGHDNEVATLRAAHAGLVDLLNEERAERTAAVDALTARLNRLNRRVTALENGTEIPPVFETMTVGSSLHREPGESALDAYDRRCRNWGVCPEVVRFFFTSFPTVWPVFGDSDVVVSFKGSPWAIAAGEYDDTLTRFFQSAPSDGRPKRWAYWHEREDDIENGAFTEADYRAAYLHLVELANAVGNPDLSAGVVLMGWTANPAGNRDTPAYLWDSSVIEWAGWDVYPGPDRADTRYKYQLCVDATKAAGIDTWLLTETGLDKPDTRAPETVAAWIPDACDIARELGFEQWHYFDSTVGGDFRLTTPVEWAAIAGEIAK